MGAFMFATRDWVKEVDVIDLWYSTTKLLATQCVRRKADVFPRGGSS